MNITDILIPMANAEATIGTALDLFASACDSHNHLQAAVELGKMVAAAKAIVSLELPMTAIVFECDNQQINSRIEEMVAKTKGGA